jgi:hypothetical protein
MVQSSARPATWPENVLVGEVNYGSAGETDGFSYAATPVRMASVATCR